MQEYQGVRQVKDLEIGELEVGRVRIKIESDHIISGVNHTQSPLPAPKLKSAPVRAPLDSSSVSLF
jgi:hypothetical protein